MDEKNKLLTTAEVANLLRVSVATVQKQAGKSLPKAIRVGAQYRFRRDEIEALLGG